MYWNFVCVQIFLVIYIINLPGPHIKRYLLLHLFLLYRWKAKAQRGYVIYLLLSDQ